MKKKGVIMLAILSLLALASFLGILGIKILKREHHKRLENVLKQEHSEAGSVYVLTYHHFLERADREKYCSNNIYTVAVEDFEMQLKYLSDNGYNSINTNDLYSWLNFEKELPEKSVLITIDDGYLSVYKYALPLLEKYNYSAIVFCIGNLISDKQEEFNPTSLQFMNISQIYDIKNNHKILEIGAHSYDLHNVGISNYTYQHIYDDVLKASQYLDTDIYSYPNGLYNNNYMKAIKNSGYKMAFKYKPSSKTYINDNIYSLSRIEVDGNMSFEQFKKVVE